MPRKLRSVRVGPTGESRALVSHVGFDGLNQAAGRIKHPVAFNHDTGGIPDCTVDRIELQIVPKGGLGRTQVECAGIFASGGIGCCRLRVVGSDRQING